MDSDLLHLIRVGLVFYIVLLCSVSIHEWAHAFIADRLGDPLPREQGRVTLNPFAHVDLLGTVIFPLLSIFIPLMMSGLSAKFIIFGWGKPVQISLPNPKTRTRDDIIIALAGPISNLFICLLTAIVGGLIYKLQGNWQDLINIVILMNAALAIFNLLPLPPLDGSHILKRLLNISEITFFKISQWSFLILLILINLRPFQKFLSKSIDFTQSIFNQILVWVAKML